MEWSSPFVIYRVKEDAGVEEVFCAEDLKKAKYWLTYIAQPWDVLCKTPLHPKHSKTSKCPEYWTHKEGVGKLSTDESKWRARAADIAGEISFPEAQQSTPLHA
jgi:hypothetical protein